MNIYEKILAIRKELPPFQFDRTAGEVKIISDEQMNKALVPLLDKHGIISIPHAEIREGGSDLSYLHLEIEFRSITEPSEVFNPDKVNNEDRMVASMAFPIDKRNFEFGATATLAEKYLYKMLFKIHTGEEGGQIMTPNPNFQKMENKHTPPVENLSGKTVEEKIKAAATLNNEEVFDGMASRVNVTTDEEIPTTLDSLVTTVINEEELPAVVEKTPEPEKEPEPSQELFKQVNEGGWKEQVPLAKCLDNVTVIKELEKYYTNQGTAIYGHADLKCCPHPIMELINKFSKRRSNLQVRTLLIQWRVGGEKDFWAAAKGQFGMEKDELLAKLVEPVIEEVKEETKPIIALPKLEFKVIDHNGLDRPTEEVLEIHNGLKKAGLTKWTILEALETIPELENVFGTKDTPADTIMSNFLGKANEHQIQLVIQKVQQSA